MDVHPKCWYIRVFTKNLRHHGVSISVSIYFCYVILIDEFLNISKRSKYSLRNPWAPWRFSVTSEQFDGWVFLAAFRWQPLHYTRLIYFYMYNCLNRLSVLWWSLKNYILQKQHLLWPGLWQIRYNISELPGIFLKLLIRILHFLNRPV